MFQLQQLGLPFGFRSHVDWWHNYYINNYCQSYVKKKHPGRANCYEKRNIN